ncbi:hypothetical protein Tco_1449431 [Tanacetum coccineum]
MSKEVGTPRYLSLVVPLKKVGDEAVHKELGDKMERGATTASSLEAEQDSGSGPRCQDTILRDVDAQTSIQFLLLVCINAAKLMLMLLGSVNAVRHMLMLPVQVPAAEVNPIIYTSCIQQFWATANVKMVNGVRQLQALIDKKKMIITESSIRSDLHLEDAEGTDCLPTTTIFEELAKMGYEKPSQKLTFYKAFFSPQWKFLIHTITQSLSAKSTAWNEFSSTMASLIICLATNQKFNLSKYIFDAMVKHLDGGVKFLLYPRFLQVFINQQLGDMSHHKKIYVNPSHTKKFFANIKRPGKDFFGRITPLFDTMMVQASEEVAETKVQEEIEEGRKVAHDETEHEESLDLEKAKSDQAIEITCLKKRVDNLEKRRKFKTTRLKRLKKVGAARRIESSNDSLGAQENASKQGRRIKDIDADAEVTLVNETQERQDEELMFDTGVLDGDEVFVDAIIGEKDEQSTKIDDSTAGEAVTTAGVEDSALPIIPITVEETLAQNLMEIKAAKPKAKGIVFHDLEKQVSKPTVSVTQSSIKDKEKGIMQEPERPLTKKDQVALDEDLARNLA